MSTSGKHTPGPWYVDDHVYGLLYIRAKRDGCRDDWELARIDNDSFWPEHEPEDRANAAFIVRACNAHDALVEACTAARFDLAQWVRAAEALNAGDRHLPCPPSGISESRRVIASVEDALSLARGRK